MALSVKKAVLWRREIENRPGTLSQSLKPFSEAGVELQIVMGYASPSGGASAVEVFPITDAKGEEAAKKAGMHAGHDLHCLIVDGDDRAGIAYDMTNAISSAGVNLHFAMCQALNKKFQAVFGFGSEADAQKASGALGKL